MKNKELAVSAVTPAVILPGGEILVQCRGFKPGLPSEARVLFGDSPGEIVSASEDRVIVRAPEIMGAAGIVLESGGAVSSAFPVTVGTRLASELHPVSSPVIARDGAVLTTISGPRGQQSPQSLMRVTREGEVTSFPCEIMNPTGLAFGPDDQLYISSRGDGTVLRYADFERLEIVAEDLGVPCGIAFDQDGTLYVGDRTGKIIRIDQAGGRMDFAHLPPSVSAFHLAVSGEGELYVSAPTIGMRDPLYRISRTGDVRIAFEGLARPQGLAFTEDGELWIATAYGGKKGIFIYSPDAKTLVHHVAGPMLVGLAMDNGDLFPVDNESIYHIRMGDIAGRRI